MSVSKWLLGEIETNLVHYLTLRFVDCGCECKSNGELKSLELKRKLGLRRIQRNSRQQNLVVVERSFTDDGYPQHSREKFFNAQASAVT